MEEETVTYHVEEGTDDLEPFAPTYSRAINVFLWLKIIHVELNHQP